MEVTFKLVSAEAVERQEGACSGRGRSMCKGPVVGVARRPGWPKQRGKGDCRQCKWAVCGKRPVSPEGECGFGFKGERVVSSGLA